MAPISSTIQTPQSSTPFPTLQGPPILQFLAHQKQQLEKPPSTPSAPSYSTMAGPQPPTIAQLLLPFLPILALALVVLFLLRILLRQFRACLYLRLQFANSNASSMGSQNVHENTMNPRLSLDSNSMVNEIAPWSEPCATPPVFMLHQSELFFPGSGFVDPAAAAAYWLDHQQLVEMLGPMPPKYDEAMKLHPPNLVQPLRIPSLQCRGQMAATGPAQTSPPPCYEQINQCIPLQPGSCQQFDVDVILPRILRQQEHPPNYAGLAASAEDLLHVVNSCQSTIQSDSLCAPEDRPCSSRSLDDNLGRFNDAASRRKALGTFVAKHASARQLQKKDSEEAN